MSQPYLYSIKFGLISFILTLNACISINLPTSENQPIGLDRSSENISKRSATNSNSLGAETVSSPKLGVDLKTPIKFDKTAKFFDTSDPLMPFVLFYGSDMTQKKIYSLSGDSLVDAIQAKLLKEPSNPELIFDLSSAYLLAGKPEKSLEISKLLVSGSNTSLSVLYNQLLCLHKLANNSEIDMITKQLVEYSSKPKFYEQADSLYLYLAEVVLRTYPSFKHTMDFDFLYNVFDFQLKEMNAPFLALVLYNRFASYEKNPFFGNNLSQFEKLIQLNPESALYKSAYARALMQNQRYDSARQVLEETLAMNPNLIDAFLTKAELLQAELKPESEVVQAYENVALMAPSWNVPVLMLSDFFYKQKKFTESAETLKRFLSKSQYSNNEIYLRLANSLFYAGNFQEAIDNYNSYTKKGYPNELSVNIMRGKAYTLLKTSVARSHAIEDFTYVIQKAAKPIPPETENLTSTYYWLGYLDRAITYFEDGQYQNAYQDLLTLFELDPINNDLKYNLTGVLGAMGRYDEAIKIGLEIPETYSDIKAVYRNLSMAYAYSKKCMESEKYAKMAGMMPKPCLN